MEESPPADTCGGEASAPADGETRTPQQYAVLKAQFKLLQEDALALATAYEKACDELRYQEECQAVMVEKLAEIRVRRMNTYLRVPENSMMFFIEESKSKLRQQHPTASRREIQRLLQREWSMMAEDEQREWHTRLHAVATKARKHEESKKTTHVSQKKRTAKSSTVASANTTQTPTAVVVSGVKATAVKRKAPPSGSTPRPEPVEDSSEKPKKKLKTEVDTKTDVVMEADDKDSKPLKSTPKSKPKPDARTKTPRAKATPRAKKPATEKPTVQVKDAGEEEKAPSTPKKSPKKTAKKTDTGSGVKPVVDSPMKKAATPRKSPAKPKKEPTPKVKKAATPKKEVTPRKKAAPKAAKRTPPKKKVVRALSSDVDDSDLDDDDDDDDDDDNDIRKGKRRSRAAQDDDSQSSGGGSGSEDDDEDQLAQLPTGAFG